MITIGIAALLLLGTSPGADDRCVVQVTVNADGEVDLTEVVNRLAERTGLEITHPDGPLLLPVQGLAAGGVRLMLETQLGSEVSIGIEKDRLTLSIPPGLLDESGKLTLQERLESLSQAVRGELRRRVHYGMHALRSYRPNDPGRPTVCLVHGMNSSSGGFLHMLPLFEEAGFGLVVYDYPFNKDLDETAPEFVRAWKAFRESVGEKRPWVIVTHSMGGLLGRFYVEGDEYDGDVSRLILIAPPNEGSALAGAQTLMQLIERAQSGGRERAGALANLGEGLGEAANDLRPGSAFLKALHAKPRRTGVEYHILAGDAGFLTMSRRKQIEAQIGLLTRRNGLLGGLTTLAVGDLPAVLDELTDGTGDGCVSVQSTKLEGVEDHVTIRANHVELIRGPMLYPEPGPVACMPYVLRWLESELPE